MMHPMLTAEDDPKLDQRSSRIHKGLPNAFSPASLLPRPACLRQHVRSRIVGGCSGRSGGRSLLDGRRWTRAAEKVRNESVVQLLIIDHSARFSSAQLISAFKAQLSVQGRRKGKGLFLSRSSARRLAQGARARLML